VEQTRFIRALERITSEMDAEIKTVLRDVADDLLAEAKKRTPQLEGTLTRSGHRDVFAMPKGVVRAVVWFDTVYAVAMHEGIFDPATGTRKPYQLGERSRSKQSSMGVEVGRKYLQAPLEAKFDEYMNAIAKAVEKAETTGGAQS
jgi:hypothetical protein